MTRTIAFLSAALTAAAVAVPARAGDWYRWRGPFQNGVSDEKGLPEKWDPSTGDNLLWKGPYGGMSSPVVMNGRVYTLTRIHEETAPNTVIAGPRTQEALVCIDAETGKEIWRNAENIFQTTVPFHRLGWTNVAADPETGNVYTLGVQCTFKCVDGKTGKTIWSRQMTEEFGMISTFGGRTNTPAVDEDQVFIGGVTFGWGDDARGQWRLHAFDKRTGRLNWVNESGGIPVDAPYNTPMIAVINGVRQVIGAAGDGRVFGFEARTGKRLWTFEASKRGLNASMLVDGGRVYVCHSEENYDSSMLGRVVCLDVTGPKPKEVWRINGIESGYGSPTLADGRLYVIGNGAQVICIDAAGGTKYWEKKVGTIGKASLVYGDGKLYVAEANGRFLILRPGEKKADILSKVDLPRKLGREYAIFGSPAISNGRVYVQCANDMYCIGAKEPKVTPTPVQEMAKEPAAGPPAHVQVVPADVLLRPGQKVKFEVRLFDAGGRPVTDLAKAPKTEWSVGQLALATPGGKVMIGNLNGEVTADGEFTAAAGPPQGGAVVARFGDLVGNARVRVLPPLPWTIDFTPSPEGEQPLTWLGAGGKFEVRDLGGGDKALVKFTRDPKDPSKPDPRYRPLYDAARTYFGASDMTDYTVRADVRGDGTLVSGEPQRSDVGIINSRYALSLLGNPQKLQINVWPPALPGERDPTGSLNATAPFAWKPDTWYRLKLEVRQSEGKAVVRGKAWPVGTDEPAEWTLTLEDPQPNRHGSPGLFAFSNRALQVYYDNIVVTANSKE
jgi:outer membrane protein assembly factor BamB